MPYVAADAGMVVISLEDPQSPRHVATIPLTDARASALQFRYLWVTTAEGLQLIDVTNLEEPRLLPGSTFPLRPMPGASMLRAPTPMSLPVATGW